MTMSNVFDNTTIVAIATPPGYGGIGVVRLSGEAALPLARRLMPHIGDHEFIPNQAAFHHLIHPETQQPVDSALVTFFKAPHSFTGENVVEISCHGSPVVLAEIIRLLKSFGARLAEPGEFSLRAFFNQRMDLAQAEAINDLIHAQTTYQAQVAVRQLRGELSKQIKPIKDNLVEIIVWFESSVEFVEDDLDPLDIERFIKRLDDVIGKVESLISTYRLGRLIRSGIKLAIIGKPNVGKSSLFNRLLGRERAIVTHLPGTTRDTLTEAFSIGGIPIELIDTAGIRETDDLVEKLGVERTRSAIADADFVIAVIEANHQPAEEDLEFFAQLPINLFVINKCDLRLVFNAEELCGVTTGRPTLKVSALTGQGIDELRRCLHGELTAGAHPMVEGGIVTNERHYSALEQALAAMSKARHDLTSGFTEEVVLVNLHQALRSLGSITGETLIGDIINQIFSTFCIGK